MDYTRKLAEFCASLNYDLLPAEVVHKAKLCLLDFVANVYGSLELEAVEQVISYVRSIGAAGPVTALGCGMGLDLHHGVLINGTTAEAIEAQDGLRFGGNHPGTAVIPAALALAETRGLGGKEVITAIAAGYEAANRPAVAMHPWHTLSGFLPTGTCGAFGAAAAAGVLMGFDSEKMVNALGNAGYLLPLSMAEQLMGGFTIKIVQGGQGALAGVMAAGMAEFGLTGAPYVLEGSSLNGGFTQITTRAEPKCEKITENLGEHYSIMDIYFKPYTACRHTHGAAQAALELAAENKINPDEIQKIDVKTYGIAELAVGKPVTKGDTFVSAQFSIPYVAAVCLTDGCLGPIQLTEKRMRDEKLLALAQKVTVSTDEELNKLYPEQTASRVEITLEDGRTVTRQVDIPRGDPRDPMLDRDLMEKLIFFAGPRDRKTVEDLGGRILDLENQENLTELIGMI